ncbi:MAG: BadF/BadG/BcrA/BcrD ATPase family protein, partial [Eubacterium sp.]
MTKKCKIGLDVGSTTIKVVVLDEENTMIFKAYRRHLSNIREMMAVLLQETYTLIGDVPVTISVTGSGGLLVSKWIDVAFVQEVVAGTIAVEKKIPRTDCAIELGGEDAKITFFEGNIEQRMNGTCAGGTGAFIDQMATLLKTDAGGLNEMAKTHTTIYPIASRCGVFSKTDIQPLLNEGAEKADIAASIFQAVVNQTISGLACGHTIRGNVAFLGGPLFFLSELRERFIDSLKLPPTQVIFPDDSNLFVAMGAAYSSEKNGVLPFGEIIRRLKENIFVQDMGVDRLQPLFADTRERQAFETRHAQARVVRGDL